MSANREIVLRRRYFSYLAVLVAAAFLVVATWAFARPAVVALSLGVGVGMLAVSLELVARYRRDVASVTVSAAIAGVSAWIVVSSQVFSQATAHGFTRGLALVAGALAIVGLTLHELASERVVHCLEVRQSPVDQSRPPGPPKAA